MSGRVGRTSPSGQPRWKITEVADLSGARLLMLHGELDIATAPELVTMLERLRKRGHPVTLDLSEVTFIDSTGLTALMDAFVDAERDGIALSVRRASRAVQRVVDLAGVGKLLGE